MNANIYNPNRPWYLLVENTPSGYIVRAAGSFKHCQKFDPADGTRIIIHHESKHLFGL